MKTLTVALNVVLFAFTGFVLATDGISKEAAYIILTLLLMLVPLFTVFAIVRSGASSGPSISLLRVAAICNIILLGFVCWAFVDQYPHPQEPGFIPFAVLTALTPILSATVLFRSGLGGSPRRRQTENKAQQ